LLLKARERDHGASGVIDALDKRPEEITLVPPSGGNAVYDHESKTIKRNPTKGAWATGRGASAARPTS
jgi:hypothetical protein